MLRRSPAVLVAGFLAFLPATGSSADLPVGSIRLPSGFRIQVWARVANARSLALAPGGTVFVGTRDDGGVYAVRPGPSPDLSGDVVRIAHGLQLPNGVAV